jgi:hypothetical protein
MANLVDQIKAYNQALENKTWSGDWKGGGENAINSAAKKLEDLGVTDLTKLKVEKNIERAPVTELYQGRPVNKDSTTGQKYQNLERFTGGIDSSTEFFRQDLPQNAKTILVKIIEEQVGTGDNISSVPVSYSLTPEEQTSYDPKTSTYGKVLGNKLVDTSTGKIISKSIDNNFIVDKYGTGNFLKGKEKVFGFIANEQGQIAPYQMSEKSGLITSPVFPVMMAMIAPGISSLLGTATGLTGAALKAATGATIGAGTAALTDQDILKGALTGGVSAGASSLINPAISGALGGGTFGDVAAGALTGGGIAELTGGDFLEGALKGGVSAGLSDYQQQLRQEQFESEMTESGLAGQTLMDSGEQTVLEPWQQTEAISQLIKELTPYQAPYVLGPNEVFAEPDIQPLPIDNSGKIAAVGAAKFLAPIAINAILPADTVAPEVEQTGFPIIPIPSEWKQPVYNQEFTPSAPIDFGTPALLAGTQWENPQQFEAPKEYNLTDLINTLNYQSVPFVPQQYDMPQQVSVADFMSQFQTPTVGTGEIIGNLGGKPVSIADIISGIQSQYG